MALAFFFFFRFSGLSSLAYLCIFAMLTIYAHISLAAERALGKRKFLGFYSSSDKSFVCFDSAPPLSRYPSSPSLCLFLAQQSRPPAPKVCIAFNLNFNVRDVCNFSAKLYYNFECISPEAHTRTTMQTKIFAHRTKLHWRTHAHTHTHTLILIARVDGRKSRTTVQ